MALSCFLLLRILRVAVSSNSGLQLCWNAINRWGFRKTHHFCHRSLEWMLCTFWTIVQFRHIFSFYYLSHLLRKDKPCALISAVLTCSGLQVSLALRSLHTGVSSPPSVPPPPPLAPASDLSQLPCHTPVTLPLFSLYYTFPSQQKPQLHVTPPMLFYKTWE